MMGWECPKCGRVYAPFVDTCVPCSSPPVTMGTLVPTYACTCGTSASCPIHPWSVRPTFVIDATGTSGCKVTTEVRR
jgi:hypothetical protein